MVAALLFKAVRLCRTSVAIDKYADPVDLSFSIAAMLFPGTRYSSLLLDSLATKVSPIPSSNCVAQDYAREESHRNSQ
jgi:hypothetical protein